ncbi:MAG: penicillin-binding protein activator [Chromatiales bacterium]
MYILHRHRLRPWAVVLAAAVFSLPACAPQQPAREAKAGAADPAQEAWDLRHAGRLEEAAKVFLRVAKRSEPPQSLRYRLHAVETLLEARQAESAREILTDLPQGKVDTDLRAWATILEARLALIEERPEEALVNLDNAAALDEHNARARDIHESRAQALQQLNRPLEAASERILLEPLLSDQGEIDANREAIWILVQPISAEELQAQLDTAPQPLRGWMELSIIVRSLPPGSPRLASQVSQWKQRHPHHPGVSLLAARIPELTGPAAFPAAPAQVALLLPLEGPLAEAGSAVRDGFIAGWYADAHDIKPSVNVYAASPDNVVQAYNEAAVAGAEVIVGPLEKAALEALMRHGALTVPTLALNRVNASKEEGAALVQFALSPEDEARNVAARARQDGRARALVMTSDDAWGERVYRAFQEEWESHGGVTLDRATYSNQAQDFATPVKQVLDIHGSQQRAADLRKLLRRDLVTEPRPRQDADFLFLAASSLQARQIQPQLLFFRAEGLPVYATSHVYLGNTDHRRDSDLNGIIFGDMPGVVAPQRNGLPPLLSPARSEGAGTHLRLFAMGVDAYRLIAELAALGTEPASRFSGETGRLSLDTNGEIVRELTWMRFVDGVAVPVESPQAAP